MSILTERPGDPRIWCAGKMLSFESVEADGVTPGQSRGPLRLKIAFVSQHILDAAIPTAHLIDTVAWVTYHACRRFIGYPMANYVFIVSLLLHSTAARKILTAGGGLTNKIMDKAVTFIEFQGLAKKSGLLIKRATVLKHGPCVKKWIAFIECIL